jgi:hypothetical protein
MSWIMFERSPEGDPRAAASAGPEEGVRITGPRGCAR